MKHYWTYITNGKYSVGTTGQSVYLLDENDNELKCFRDIKYGYNAIFSPDGSIFVVKSTDGRLAVYSIEVQSLIHKFRFSKVDGAQDDGYCFSSDGLFFINLERQIDDLHSAISFYNTKDFSMEFQFILDENMMVNEIEYDSDANEYFVLGFLRNPDGIYHSPFIGKLKNKKIDECVTISDKEYDFYSSFLTSKRSGFTSKSLNIFTDEFDFEAKDNLSYSLAKLYCYRIANPIK